MKLGNLMRNMIFIVTKYASWSTGQLQTKSYLICKLNQSIVLMFISWFWKLCYDIFLGNKPGIKGHHACNFHAIGGKINLYVYVIAMGVGVLTYAHMHTQTKGKCGKTVTFWGFGWGIYRLLGSLFMLSNKSVIISKEKIIKQ